MGNRIAAGAICCTLIARRSAGVVLLDCALAEPVTPNRAAAMVMAVMARKRRRLRRLWLISSNIDLSPIGKQSSPQTLSRHIPGCEGSAILPIGPGCPQHAARLPQSAPPPPWGVTRKTAWLAPSISTLWLCARSAYMRSRLGLTVLSSFATSYQLGFSFQAGLVIGVVNTLTAVSICECAMNSACSRGKSAAKSVVKLAGSRKTKPSGVPIGGLDGFAHILPLAAAASPCSGAWAAADSRGAAGDSLAHSGH